MIKTFIYHTIYHICVNVFFEQVNKNFAKQSIPGWIEVANAFLYIDPETDERLLRYEGELYYYDDEDECFYLDEDLDDDVLLSLIKTEPKVFA